MDRSINTMTEISKQEKVDVFMIYDTLTQDEKTSFNNMFEVIELIKNGHVGLTIYNKYGEVIYNRLQIVFFTNREVFGYLKNLSRDRWYNVKIIDEHKLIKLGWTDANFWDSGFDLATSQKLVTEYEEKTNDNFFLTDFR